MGPALQRASFQEHHGFLQHTIPGHYTLIRKCEIPYNTHKLRSCLEDMPVSIFSLWAVPNPKHASSTWCVLCLAQKSLNLCPLSVGWFFEKLLAKEREITKLPPHVHSAVPPQQGCCLLFSSQHPALPMESLGRYWHCWCFHGEQKCSMEKRLPGSTSNPGIWHTEESWKEQRGNSISRAGKAVVERRVSLLLPLSVATQLKICERRQARRFWCYFY